ncbi:carboxylating nicotinate-nucleotide diphosphorylase [Schlesneria paludicola]|uniref:carboxylating nicotinate-nucleotide diphosphorylase n=1 Tax=Schlesneria paludicola TaxID=360056 RepID=UPI00058E86B7|nr:carboxylating nicotinate-nucleotide diphosphorylase [Schlesneria paludicola]
MAAAKLVDLALAEDLSIAGDLTCAALIRPDQTATVQVVARRDGVLAGSPIGRMVFEKLDPTVRWGAKRADGETVAPGTVIADVSGPLSSLLIGERTMLNFMTHLSGIATITRRFVDAVAGTRAKVLDTRKTLPGWRLLEKYAVRCGGGTNHRMGLYDGILIKDNHLAAWTESASIAEAVRVARASVAGKVGIEVEVDTLQQLEDALGGAPDIVLLDNMNADTLRQAVSIRNRLAPKVQLEASGGITLETVSGLARTGVERISVGALTHSAPALDLAFDWSSSTAT